MYTEFLFENEELYNVSTTVVSTVDVVGLFLRGDDD